MTKITTTPGGVARNMVEAVKKLGHDPMFLSAVGGDLFGRELLLRFQQIDIVTFIYIFLLVNKKYLITK